MFAQVPQHVNFPELEQEVLQFWQEGGIYEESLRQRAGAPRFVFYEGPPTANGLPHPGHCLTRAIKDLFPRYRTMRGYLCERKGGWDTHGLPVEVEVCKELGIHSKAEIERYGVEPFIHRCQESVWRYMKEWERLTERLGFWIHLDEAYVTYHQSYVESVWWSLKNLFDRGLLYQGHKIVWWWAQGGTALSAGEVGQGYREVADPSVYVRLPLVDDPNTSLLIWTTTPWTLPNNQFAAVHPRLTYSTVVDAETGQRLILAADLVESVAHKVKRALHVESSFRGETLIGLRYRPPFDFYWQRVGERKGALKGGGEDYVGWRVLPAEFVTIESGTGVVHQAPAFGEVDYEVLLADQARFVDGQGPELICGVAPDGTFTSEVPAYAGRWVKDADKDICRDMRARGVLYHQEQFVHEYPFCWRAEDDPLIQYPRQSWFIRTTQFKDRMLANNRQINWLPEHIREGRFGNFLESNVDWALSRERYWGTPLPIWVCSRTGRAEAISSYDELLTKEGVRGMESWEEAKRARPELPDDLRVHKPYIDDITYQSPFHPEGRMHRVPEVIDCWYDSGAMPFAQWGYPRGGRREFNEQFPADFISEALDQTRGWFYSLLAISTLLFGDDAQPDPDAPRHSFPHPFRNCIVLGLMLGEDGGKMSKSRRNYREPQEIFERYGADALRWYFFANQAPWTSIRYNEAAIKESIPEFLLRLWNVFFFFVNYAKIDGFNPGELIRVEAGQLDRETLATGKGFRPLSQRSELDRWVLSELHHTIAAVVERMDAYDNYAACRELSEFVDALSNWYVRRSRDRFWCGQTDSEGKLDAHWTLYECLVGLSKLIAPFTPFLGETMWRQLAGVFAGRAVDSVHLCDYPTPQREVQDVALSQQMRLAREIASLGRSARMAAKLKVRQPLTRVEVVLADESHRAWLEAHADLIAEELNVKQVEFTLQAEQYITYEVKPNFKLLGPLLGPDMPEVKQLLADADGSSLLGDLKRAGRLRLKLSTGREVQLTPEHIQIGMSAKPGWTAAQGTGCVVVLSTELTPALIREGLARDLVRHIQDLRKQMNLAYTDRIQVGMVTSSGELREAVAENLHYVRQETLAVVLGFQPLEGSTSVGVTIGNHQAELHVTRCPPAVR